MTITDSVEYGQLKIGVRNEAVILAIRPLLDKFSGALSNGLVGFIAVTAGMTGAATASSITEHGIRMFNLLAFLAPAMLMMVSICIYYFKVTLTEERHEKIVKELSDRLALKNDLKNKL